MTDEVLDLPEDALFIAADEPLLIFANARDAGHQLEAIDVQDGVYGPLFGPSGEPYVIETIGQRVVITRSDEVARPDELKALLLKHLLAAGEQASAGEGSGRLQNERGGGTLSFGFNTIHMEIA